jgi:hypothetical protein
MTPSIWNVSISATIRGSGPGGGVFEARVTIPLHPSKLTPEVTQLLIDTAQMPMPEPDAEGWGI